MCVCTLLHIDGKHIWVCFVGNCRGGPKCQPQGIIYVNMCTKSVQQSVHGEGMACNGSSDMFGPSHTSPYTPAAREIGVCTNCSQGYVPCISSASWARSSKGGTLPGGQPRGVVFISTCEWPKLCALRVLEIVLLKIRESLLLALYLCPWPLSKQPQPPPPPPPPLPPPPSDRFPTNLCSPEHTPVSKSELFLQNWRVCTMQAFSCFKVVNCAPGVTSYTPKCVQVIWKFCSKMKL